MKYEGASDSNGANPAKNPPSKNVHVQPIPAAHVHVNEPDPEVQTAAGARKPPRKKNC
jgi:hypothetical protein